MNLIHLFLLTSCLATASSVAPAAIEQRTVYELTEQWGKGRTMAGTPTRLTWKVPPLVVVATVDDDRETIAAIRYSQVKTEEQLAAILAANGTKWKRIHEHGGLAGVLAPGLPKTLESSEGHHASVLGSGTRIVTITFVHTRRAAEAAKAARDRDAKKVSPKL
jgi:hypothetical protein